MIAEQGGAVVFEIEAGKEIAAKFPTGKAAIHQNHGLFTVGETVDEAVFWFITMERSCQAQLLAMAAGTPAPHQPRGRVVHAASRPASRSPAGSASRRCGRRSAAPTPISSSDARAPRARSHARGPVDRPGSRFLDTASPEAMFVLVGVAQNIGAMIAVVLFDQCRAGRRSHGSASSARRSSCSPCPVASGAAGPAASSAPPRVFGIATASMNTFFYLAIDRIELGKGVTIEFIGPIAVAAVLDTHPPQRRRPRAGRRAASRARGLEIGGNAVGLLVLLAASAMWAAYIVMGSRVAQDRTAASPGSASVWPSAPSCSTPFGAPGSGPVWTSPRLLVACLWSACSPTPSATASTST